MAKHIAIIDTDEYKNFKFFEDGCGEYLVARDKNAQSDEWIRLPIVKAETNGDMIKALFLDLKYDILNNTVLTNMDNGAWFSLDWWNAPYERS